VSSIFKTDKSFVKIAVPLTGIVQEVFEVFDFIDIDTLNTTADVSLVYVRINGEGLPSRLSDVQGSYIQDGRRITITWDPSQTGKQITLILGREYRYYSYRGSMTLARETIGLMNILNNMYSLMSGTTGANVNIVNSGIIVPVETQSNYKTNFTLYSGTVTASGISIDIDFGIYKYVEIELNVTAISGTSASLDFYIEGKFEASGDYKHLVYQTGITAAGSYYFTINPLIFRYIRVRWNVSGTTPSITFGVYAQVMA